MFIETSSPAAFGDQITVFVTLPSYEPELALDAIVRWTVADGMGVQFGPMGALATLAITEATR